MKCVAYMKQLCDSPILVIYAEIDYPLQICYYM